MLFTGILSIARVVAVECMNSMNSILSPQTKLLVSSCSMLLASVKNSQLYDSLDILIFDPSGTRGAVGHHVL